MSVEGILHVTVPVSDLSRSKEFYETVLEARPVGPDDEDATTETATTFWFEVGQDQYLQLSIEATENQAAPLTFGAREADLVGLRARLDALDRSYRESSTSLTFSDPDGNRLEVTTWAGPA